MPSLRIIVAGAALALVGTTQAHHIELPECLDPFQPYVYSGCYQDGVPGTSDQALLYRSSKNQYQMTVEKCVSECKGNGFRYAGLKYWGVCYCGSSVSGAPIAEEECNLPCSGDETQTCGGTSTINIWQDPTFKTTTIIGGASGTVIKNIADYKPIGCYTDTSDKGRALMWGLDYDGSDMTPTKCLNGCADQGFPLAGIEYGGECYCGNVLANDTAKADPSDCNMNCNGDNTFKCGGSGRLSVYVSNDLQSLQPCGWKAGDPISSSSSVVAASSAINNGNPAASSSANNGNVNPAASSSANNGNVNPAASSSANNGNVNPAASSSANNGNVNPAASSSANNGNVNPAGASTTSTTTMKSSSTSKSTTTSCTTTAPMCTATMVVPNNCEYKAGGWCAPSTPDFQDQDSCQKAYNTCAKNIAACFQGAGWPGVLDCFNFSKWCDGVQGYCASTCSRGRNCNKHSCLKSNQPQGGNSVQTTTSIFPCAATSASSTVPPASATSVAPLPSNICQQASSRWFNYGPGNPVAGIEMPLVGCNDLKSDFSQKPFKLYTDASSNSCKSYQRTQQQQNNACADACKTQYDQCNNVYVQSCKKLNGGNSKRGHSHFHKRALEKSGIEPRWFNFFGNDGWQSAQTKCAVQYQDCLNENAQVNAASRCQKWGSGV
ncbi:hypothetical protein FZEAL_1231 [Fusarium zealandicum]|uniref:WSC domain-containing protein n=1 Tax=Fusarium zealandicum TaxID=1053134 RepID=A0A8H4UTV9_9HYPO|nr:hypothetical protein FZEAL_1231 [Fusarium zealandicum]